MKYGHGWWVLLNMSEKQSETVQFIYHPIMGVSTECLKWLWIHLRWLWSRVGYKFKDRPRCSVLLPNYYWHPKIDDQVRKNQHNNQIIVVPCSTSQRGTFKSSSTCHGPCWPEIWFLTGVWSIFPEIDHIVLKNMIDQSSIEMPRRLYPWTPQNLEVRRLITSSLWITIMQGEKYLTDWEVVSWYMWTLYWCSGSQTNSLQWCWVCCHEA